MRQAIAAAERAWRNRQAALQRTADEDGRLRDKRSACLEAEAAATAWRAKWEQAVAKLGLPAGAGRAEAEAALAAWDEIRQRLTNRSQTVRRLDGIDRNIAEFRAGLAQLVAELGPDGAGLDAYAEPEGTVRALVSRLAAARQAAARHSHAAAGHAVALAAVEQARRDLRAASDAAANLRSAHGLAEGDDALAIADKVEARRRCAAELEGKRRALAEASDGLAIEPMRQEVAATMPDAAVAELEALKGEETRLVSESQAEAQRQTSAQHGLEALVGRRSVAAAAQQARNAAQEVNFQLQRWLRLTAAKALLERALERYRAENQHPLVRRGAEIFTALAGTGPKPIVRLDIDYGDGSDPILIGIRRDGAPCRVEGMSEGTRDQLFLSLRIAAVEQQVQAGEPMPFIADDLFVTSDDERVVAGLAALAELGRSTQVILFTHHRHVAAAAATLPEASVKLHRLPAPPLAEPARSLAG